MQGPGRTVVVIGVVVGFEMTLSRKDAGLSLSDIETLPDCTRCGHPPDWHRLSSDAVIQDPTDDRARFRCLGYDCTTDGPVPAGGHLCGCPNYERWERS